MYEIDEKNLIGILSFLTEGSMSEMKVAVLSARAQILRWCSRMTARMVAKPSPAEKVSALLTDEESREHKETGLQKRAPKPDTKTI